MTVKQTLDFLRDFLLLLLINTTSGYLYIILMLFVVYAHYISQIMKRKFKQ